MSGKATISAPAQTFVDLSGTSTEAFKNPYEALIAACDGNAAQIQDRYTLHRVTRNTQQKDKMLDRSFPGVSIDPILHKLENELGYKDPRHCLVFWARPTEKVKGLIERVQNELRTVAQNLWLMPRDNLHMTALEITHSRTAPEISQIVENFKASVPLIADYPSGHRARLIRPMIGFDASALALSLVPAAGESLSAGRTLNDDQFTYHHLRRDLFNLCEDAGVKVDSRYVVPSSHLTIGRFIKSEDFTDEKGVPSPGKMEAFVKKIEEINEWLKWEYWPEYNNGVINDGGEWIVGEGKGLDCRMGTLWYGGGESVYVGKGF
ncbi:hypothetical protein GQ43DRAFT_417135 [Delitschia confertaspora ATCC 74209]|uniref:RNA ligase/cyclic nucleotide phosphodiesterase n=1 Tax=Delitschia confertaspora ATCC 74209 TaxID=1513339 RepID=A0A9P4JPQ2_9PLEO|nr:hypothetical protein GQ43DRAFT_417135 [Delitschia confertaspora ATCC 74209]